MVVPGVSPAVTMLTVRVAGVAFDDKLAWNHPPGQLAVGAVFVLKESGRAIPELVI